MSDKLQDGERGEVSDHRMKGREFGASEKEGQCNAEVGDGVFCWEDPVAANGRCELHGGASTGPRDTSYLESNDFAKGNPGGGAPEGNENAKIHGGFSD